MKVDLRTWVIWALRKASYRWPPRGACLRAAAADKSDYLRWPGEKVSKLVRNYYFCAHCENVFSRKGVSIDHIEPVVDPRKGWQGFDEYIKRMFCSEAGFQILCSACHDIKTKKENKIRQKYRRAA
jgi:5-methylcytosine-specific restriction endonuclease McrA